MTMILFGKLTQADLPTVGFNTEFENPKQLLEQKNNLGLRAEGHIIADVLNVIDGDTFLVKYKNKKYKIRMLDIDTPESVKENVHLQTYSKEASDKVKMYLSGKQVDLYFEKELRDKYKRILAHVFLKNGLYLNGFLVKNGFARAVSYKPNQKYKNYFLKLQRQAQQEKLGFWSLSEDQRPFIRNRYGDYVPSYYQEAS